MKLQIAIDGPASAGKSTVAKLVAKKLGYVYCDTGAMYRATTYAAKKNHVAYDDDQGLKEMLEKTEIRFVPAEPEQKVFVNETEVTKTIRLPEIANNVSTVSAQKSVRADLTERQRMIAEQGGIVMTSGQRCCQMPRLKFSWLQAFMSVPCGVSRKTLKRASIRHWMSWKKRSKNEITKILIEKFHR